MISVNFDIASQFAVGGLKKKMAVKDKANPDCFNQGLRRICVTNISNRERVVCIVPCSISVDNDFKSLRPLAHKRKSLGPGRTSCLMWIKIVVNWI